MQNFSQTKDVVNEDGSVTRTTTTDVPNGDKVVKVHTFTADEFNTMQEKIAQQIADLQALLNNGKEAHTLSLQNRESFNRVRLEVVKQ